ncbi:Predicted branched-chain amino acid permease (azaleucine resistance) [Granulicatella balaenopterae]|uniref:Predicted branched-chain amino acid permease (Azaleucine resistance) n=1 Tax=Granulicatella balaenopterae TaxID=137733 RepID=A0A1H9P0C8_9LACT|nr:AzlC family ABC transporter permease [Granulicatella balaenopterae]SER41638.1 Predicted branched-chain amino acid permease (azaleucine resistance) [Granulicatella balaenopterae]
MSKRKENIRYLVRGMHDAAPIALGYFAVAFAIGITAREVGLTTFQAWLASLLVMASAGQYAGFLIIGSHGSLIEMALMILIANARYFLMGCAFSQKIDPNEAKYHRLLMAHGLTDEIFALGIAKNGYVHPFYQYGAMLLAMPGWSFGTVVGVIAGSILPPSVVAALGVALFGMFIAIIIPAAKDDRSIGIVVVTSFVVSLVTTKWTMLASMSPGTRTVILTIILSVLAALLLPLNEEERKQEEAGDPYA